MNSAGLYNQLTKTMPITKIAGINFSQPVELLLLVTQIVCYVNQYYVVVFLLGPLSFPVILILTFLNSRALLALYSSNSTHAKTNSNAEGSQYCKRCSNWILHRDHHCIFTGRCVQKANYCYFMSYLLYSYLLSTILVGSILNENRIKGKQHLKQYALSLVFGLASGLYFLIFTAGLLSSSFRSITLGIYTVDELKKNKTPVYSNSELRKMWFSGKGRSILWKNFKQNWKSMVGEEISLKDILLVL